MGRVINIVSNLPWRIEILRLNELREHEEINPAYLEELLQEIVRDGVLKKPIIVDCRTMIILDGHHRYNVLRKLGAQYIPALLVDYCSDRVKVGSWRKNWRVSKELVIEAGLSGKKLPYKTSRHRLVGVEIPDVNIPLEKLGVKNLEKIRVGKYGVSFS